jgi:hypothetical protein
MVFKIFINKHNKFRFKAKFIQYILLISDAHFIHGIGLFWIKFDRNRSSYARSTFLEG